MKILVRNVIRWGSYPIIFGSCVALLERIQPYENEWLEDYDDTLVES